MFPKVFRKKNKNAEPVPVGEVLAAVMAGLGVDPAQAQARNRLSHLWQNWSMVMGPELAELARPLGHHRDLLLIGAEDAMLAQELHLMSGELLERVNAFMEEPFFGGVKVSLLMGKPGLDVTASKPLPDEDMGWRAPRVVTPDPIQARGVFLEGMDPDSPVARAYSRFAESSARRKV
ncbi:DUF721 domain-containing protein [Desulfovibrio intestinalis]|uniref:DUF721 domain-containing protein n=1 Tax=Desulfovibrio intestinalis TaxID=58621 RepID=A0A7W8C465_9BACT|nr:DUF721 domain-containing protein [Desulfovibrio intestinalis]MBB5144054.1 hypothetical protein [Desulfovibrio intestinalis]